ncbi:ABC transporter ATP-binding protein [Patescibacteria group bacterium]|nr:ABC transporter ATP-binding protein [Patescibacteria group bacterium]HOM78247.1 ABC transporter ATP-binding protein [bacterium]
MSDQPVIRTNNLVKTYNMGKVVIHALKGISITIEKGDFLSIVGKSGSGKSTLMHLLGLLDTPTSGEIYLLGKDTTKYSEKEMARIRNKEIGFVFQSYNLLPRATALENVMLPLKYSNVPQKEWVDRAKELLVKMGLEERMQNKSNELSGGQKQRVAIARALVNEPSIILADEPTGNLDSKTGAEIEELLGKLNSEGRTIVIVTHDEDLAKITPKRITILDGLVIK